MSTPFDDALMQHSLRAAADAYARRHGTPGTTAYRTAWLEFRRRIRTSEDLQRWEAALAAKRRARQQLAQRAAKAAGEDTPSPKPSLRRTAASPGHVPAA